MLGEGGFVDAPVPFLKRLREYCTEHGIVLILDEIQTGFGRTGTLFAAEQYGIVPDLMTLAKGLGSGLPISAVVGRAEIMDAPAEGAIGGTYGGNPVACASALAVLDAFEDGKILARSRALGVRLRARLQSLQLRHAHIGDVRGLGPMLGIELVKNKTTKEPDQGPHRRARAVLLRARAHRPHGGDAGQRHPAPDAARDRGRGARRGPRRAGARARGARGVMTTKNGEA